MDLYLMRHGRAEERGPDYPDDSLRPLTDEGERRVQQIARGMEALGMIPAQVVTSPLARARRTAELVARHLDLADRLEESPHLACDGDPEALIEELRERHPDVPSLLLVGHQPDLGFLTSRLLIGSLGVAVHFKKGGVSHLELRGGFAPGRRAILVAHLAPKQLMRIET